MPDTEQGIETSGTLSYFDQPPTAATVFLIPRPPRERLVRALLVLLGCWALAAVTILIPILHVVLVPVFFLAGPFFAWRRLREHATLLAVRGSCPACGTGQDHRMREPWKPAVAFDCAECHRRIVLETHLPRAAESRTA